MAKTRDHLDQLEGRIGYRFKDRALLREALTHGSAAKGRDNQRLEFLGDALLNFTVTRVLYDAQPDWQEGSMSKLRGQLVRTDSLHAWALAVGLDQALSAAHPGTLPRMGPKPLADALEALLAAIYLDAQATGAEADALIRSLIEQRFLADIRAAVPEALTRLDPKTHLQETAARLGLASPVYSLLGQSGPDHALRFRVRVAIGDLAAEAEGMTRKRAEGTAAKGLLDILGTRTK